MNIGMSILYQNKMVSYETFVKDVAAQLCAYIEQSKEDPDIISQRRAYEMFGRSNVQRWVRQGRISPLAKRPGKIEYKTADLRLLQRKNQDYL